jgi:hypothetical protein
MLNKMVQAPVQQPVQQPAPVQVPVQVPVQALVQQAPVQAPVVQVKPSTLDFLNSNLDEALTIEDCFEILKNPEHNHYLFEEMFTHEGIVKTIINPKFSLIKHYNSWTTNAVDIIAALFYKFEKKELPFYICTKNKNSYLYIKTLNGWVKSSEKDADDLLLRFCNKALISVGLAITNTYDIFKKAPTKFVEIFEINRDDNTACNFDKWQHNHKAQIINKLVVFKEDCEMAVKKLKTLMLKMDPNNPDSED